MFWDALCACALFQRTVQMKSWAYLIIDLGCISIPFLASFYKKRPFYTQWKSFFISNVMVALFFLVWDAIFTQMGIWGFNPDYLLGLDIYNLPIEEVLFFICIPYACSFTYYALKYLAPKVKTTPIHWIGMTVMVAISMGFILGGLTQYYTFYTGLFTLIFLLWVMYLKVDMGYVFLTYLLIIPFFLASNGILTGYITESPIVWYNHSENFNTRIGTIPVEDFIYGFLLIAGNIVIMEKLNSRFSKH